MATIAQSRLSSRIRNVSPWIVMGILVTPILYLLAAFYSGGGHSLTSMILLFPYRLLAGFLFKDIIEWPQVILIVIQFPTYAAILALAVRRNRAKLFAIAIAALHLLAVAAGLMIYHYWQM